jgi:hypothetical protein
MDYAYPKIFDSIDKAVQRKGSIRSRMHDVIEECRSQYPHGDWEKFETIDFNQESYASSHWLKKTLAQADHQTVFKGLWFGLANPVEATGAITADLYVTASPYFDPDGLDWACKASYTPEFGYFNSQVLAAIYGIAYSERGLEFRAEYPLILAYGAMLARSALQDVDLTIPFDKLEGASVGFDGGDFLFLGRLDKGRLITKEHSRGSSKDTP